VFPVPRLRGRLSAFVRFHLNPVTLVTPTVQLPGTNVSHQKKTTGTKKLNEHQDSKQAEKTDKKIN
jgi:hypothetical protein